MNYLKSALRLLALMPTVAFADDVYVEVDGMVCAFCAQGLRHTLINQDAVESVQVDMDNAMLVAKGTAIDQLSDDAIRQLITDTGYDVRNLSRPGQSTEANLTKLIELRGSELPSTPTSAYVVESPDAWAVYLTIPKDHLERWEALLQPAEAASTAPNAPDWWLPARRGDFATAYTSAELFPGHTTTVTINAARTALVAQISKG